MRFRSDEPEPRLLDEPRGEPDRTRLQIVPVAAPDRRPESPFPFPIPVDDARTGVPPLHRRDRRAATRH